MQRIRIKLSCCCFFASLFYVYHSVADLCCRFIDCALYEYPYTIIIEWYSLSTTLLYCFINSIASELLIVWDGLFSNGIFKEIAVYSKRRLNGISYKQTFCVRLQLHLVWVCTLFFIIGISHILLLPAFVCVLLYSHNISFLFFDSFNFFLLSLYMANASIVCVVAVAMCVSTL